MKKLTILDEEFITTESSAITALQAASKLINNIKMPVISMSCNESEQVRFSPAYIQLRADINPVQSVNEIVSRCVNAITSNKKSYSLEESATLSSIYNIIYGIPVTNINAIEEATNIFGDIDGIDYNKDENRVDITESNVLEFRKKIGIIREDATRILSELNNAVNVNNLNEVSTILQKFVLMKEFANTLKV